MSAPDIIAVLAAGVAAGMINVVVGSGTLVTFPVLLAVGYSPLVANVSNTIGLVPGSVAGAIGYRDRLAGRRALILRMGSASLAGGVVGAVALLTLPDSAFEFVVPVLVALAVVLVAAQPWLSARLASRQRPATARAVGPAVLGATFATGVYGGYFGAAQGVILLGFMGVMLSDDLQDLNGIKNVLAGTVNAVAAAIFIATADVAWGPVALIALGSALGGTAGAKVARRLPPKALRGVVIVVGLTAFAQLLLR